MTLAPPPWPDVLTRMMQARSAPLYMPAMVLALCELADRGLAPDGVVQFTDIEAVFDDLLAPQFPHARGKAWEPFFHLSKTARLWTLYRGSAPAVFADLRAGRPKSRGSLVKRADQAIVEPALWVSLQVRPAAVAAHVLSALADSGPLRQRLGEQAGGRVGRPYRATPAPVLTASPTLLAHDPAAAHAGTVTHHVLVAQLAARLRAARREPLLPRSLDPQFDLAWRGQRLHLIEVKSLSSASEVHQLRLGLGQLVEYRHRTALREGRAPDAVLAVERRPANMARWLGVCRSVGVRLVCGPQWVGVP